MIRIVYFCIAPSLTNDPRRESELRGYYLVFVVFLVQMELSCVLLWRPEALDCRVPIPPEALELAYA